MTDFFGERMRDTVIFDNEVYVVDTCNVFGDWETMVAKLDLKVIEDFYNEGANEECAPFDIEDDEIKEFVIEWAEECFEFYHYNWQGQKIYANKNSAYKGHGKACENPRKWIDVYE